LITLPLVFLLSWLNLSHLNDPFIGADIIHEAGYGYVIQNYIAAFVGATLPPAGVFAWFRRKKKQPLS